MKVIVRWLVFAPLTVGLAFACTVTAQRRLDAMREDVFHDELLYLPNEKLLTHFTAGMNSIVADVLWIKCIQYTAKHFKGDGKFTWLNHMCRTITRLDPHFVAVYRYGGVFLAMLKADDDACIELLKDGMAHNPDAWELPHEIAMTYLLNRPEHPDTPVQAAKYLAMAVGTGRAPRYVANLAATIQERHDLAAVEREMWETTLRGDDELLRQLAERKLQELDLRETCALLDKAIAAYAERRGAPPGDLRALVAARFLDAVPSDPLGGRFFVDADGKAQNTTVLDDRVNRSLNAIRTGLGAFRKKHERWPESLDELEADQVMTEVPGHPYAGRAWQYDPATGEIE